jgi:trafficking kinesin-binding protein 1
LAEVEIISLVQELIPRYRLRADTDFACSNEDFIQTPRIDGSDFEALTNTQIRALLDYYGNKLFHASFIHAHDDSLFFSFYCKHSHTYSLND